MINAKLHGVIDYAVVLFLWASPSLFILPETASIFTYVLGGIHLVLTLATNFEMGVLKVIPFRIHGMIELVVGLALIGVAFYLGSMEGELARNFYIGFGAAVLFTWALTNYKKSST